MEMSRVTSKYQATVPADVRAALGVKAGDRLGWEVGDDGKVNVRRLDDKIDDPKWQNATLIDAKSFGEWLSEEDEEAWRDYQPG
jgi:antitoxin PrlF